MQTTAVLIPADVEWDTYTCSQCTGCTRSVCNSAVCVATHTALLHTLRVGYSYSPVHSNAVLSHMPTASALPSWFRSDAQDCCKVPAPSCSPATASLQAKAPPAGLSTPKQPQLTSPSPPVSGWLLWRRRSWVVERRGRQGWAPVQPSQWLVLGWWRCQLLHLPHHSTDNQQPQVGQPPQTTKKNWKTGLKTGHNMYQLCSCW
jgi:hypothetical protein